MVNTVIENIKVSMDKALPLLSAMCDRIGLARIIDDHIGPVQNETIVT